MPVSTLLRAAIAPATVLSLAIAGAVPAQALWAVGWVSVTSAGPSGVILRYGT
jgi:hypothetical protein